MAKLKLPAPKKDRVTLKISDVQPGALAEAMAALEREQKLSASLADAVRGAELGAASAFGEDLTAIAQLNDPVGALTAAGIAGNPMEQALRAFTTDTDDLMRRAGPSINDPLGEFSAVTRMEQDLADSVKNATGPLGMDASVFDGELSLSKAAGELYAIDSLSNALGVTSVGDAFDVFDEHKRLSDMINATRSFHVDTIDAGAISHAIPTSRAEDEIPSLQKGSTARQKITSAKSIGELVRAARRKMQLNQQEFADLAGVGRRFVSELESGKPTLEFDKVMKACAAAGIDLTASGRTSS